MASLMSGPAAPKQIRFVNNQGQPPSKRRRINAACLTCRKRKTRCAGERPTCSTCVNNGQVCQGYSDPSEKRKEELGQETGSQEYYARSNGSVLDPQIDQVEGDGEEDASERASCKIEGEEKLVLPDTISPHQESEASPPTPALPRPRTQSSECSRDMDETARNNAARPFRRTVSFSEDSRLSSKESPSQYHGSHRVPYFRYFGPTAIVPGFKQMVVNLSVRDRRRSRGGSFSTNSPGSNLSHGALSNASLHDPVFESLEDTPIYDQHDPAPIHPLILNLVKTFFLHLGCNYPFLREKRVLRMVKEKRVEPILVDSMCALAARFSDTPIVGNGANGPLPRSEYGHAFAQRAKAATVDTFPCPSVGAVQAFLLMAYEAFGANQDSALWMYLGLAIRMAVDLGLQKMVGVKYQGDKDPLYTKNWNRKGTDSDVIEPVLDEAGDTLSPEEQQEVEQERVDTFWSTFILDRFISSGTGRPVTIGDDEFELKIPEPVAHSAVAWPAPFPVFIRVIQLYGRVSDVLNHIRSAKDLTQDKLRRLVQMENDLTRLYQRQDPRLHFNVFNFQEYVKAGQGTIFILLHFWFHALIIILHQPTLLTPFCSMDRIHQLLPNSRELSMSSAKTIADILAFAELIDPKSFIGNPFTSQPMYIAACAFLMESVANSSNPTSRDGSPPGTGRQQGQQLDASSENKTSKHSLLASAANQNYQRCYKSLQQLHTYWGGVKYILTALDQKSKGIWDCETYTNEEYESAKLPNRKDLSRISQAENPASPKAPPIAWSLTGTTNSPNSSLTLLYQNMNAANPQLPAAAQHTAVASAATPPGNMIYDPIRQSVPETSTLYAPAYPQPNISAVRYSVSQQRDPRTASDLGQSPSLSKTQLRFEPMPPNGLDHSTAPGGSGKIDTLSTLPPAQTSAFVSAATHPSPFSAAAMLSGPPSAGGMADPALTSHHHPFQDPSGSGAYMDFAQSGLASGSYCFFGSGGPITDVITYDSHDIDIAALGLPNELMPSWLEYLPEDILGLFDGSPANGGRQNHHIN